MDSLTHIVLGGCIGELIAGKKLGKKAIFLGAFANSIPDIDVVASLWLPISRDLLAHRGFTHSILFVVLITPILAFLSAKIFSRQHVGYIAWVFFWGIQIFTHLFIDSFNAYGTGLFEPFSHYRVSFNSMFVADPLFTLWPAIAFVVLLILRKNNEYRRTLAKSAITLCVVYLLLGIIFKASIDRIVERDLSAKNLPADNYFTTPTPLNNLLWYIVIPDDSGYHIGYRSVFDQKKDIDYHFDYRNDSLLQSFSKDDNLHYLKRFSKGYYSADKWHDTIVFNDLRFGEIAGWSEPHPRLIFYYYLQHPSANDMIVQRGRFAKWDKEQFISFVNRIKGTGH